jgi:hypothetical protein
VVVEGAHALALVDRDGILGLDMGKK